MENIKGKVIAAVSVIMSWLGVLAIPVFLMVGCNVVDYITGLMAAPYRNEKISSYKGIHGIIKKVGMWILVLIGAWVDILLEYAAIQLGFTWKMGYIVGTVVAVWLTVNEMISILENLRDAGIKIPPFLIPIMNKINGAMEETMNMEDTSCEE